MSHRPEPVFPVGGTKAREALKADLKELIEKFYCNQDPRINVEKSAKWLTKLTMDNMRASTIDPSIRKSHKTFEKAHALILEYRELRDTNLDNSVPLPRVPSDFSKSVALTEKKLRALRASKGGGPYKQIKRVWFIETLIAFHFLITREEPFSTITPNDHPVSEEGKKYYGSATIEFIENTFSIIEPRLSEFLPASLLESKHAQRFWALPTTTELSKIVQETKRKKVDKDWIDERSQGIPMYEEEAKTIFYEIYNLNEAFEFTLNNHNSLPSTMG